jgi:1,2-diacylglycerol 3-beta-galactosyltransferase
MAKAKKILIIGVTAGGGHMSNAYSIEAWIKKLHPEVHVTTYNAFSKLLKLFGRDIVSLLYYITSVHMPWVWKKFIDSWYTKTPSELDKSILRVSPYLFGKNRTKKYIEDYQPDLIITTYAYVVTPVQSILKEIGLEHVPVKLVITDIFSAPKYWFGNKANEWWVMSEEAQQIAETYVEPYTKIQQIPPLLHPKFVLAKQKKSNGSILLVAGGEGVNQLNAVLRLIAPQFENRTIQVICAKDVNAYHIAVHDCKKNNWSHVNVHGFVNNMEEFMAECEVALTKAGPATIFELLWLEKKILCYNYVYGTEKENIDFLERNNLAVVETDIKKIPEALSKLLDNTTRLSTYPLTIEYSTCIETLIKV